jgi:phytoene/squalene synthetase
VTKLCDECETVAHCLKHGCIPKQTALDKKAENARELGLDYEPVQEPDHSDELTIAYLSGVARGKELAAQDIERLVAFARADERNRTWTQEHWTEYERSIAEAEREACAKVADLAEPYQAADLIRARGNT